MQWIYHFKLGRPHDQTTVNPSLGKEWNFKVPSSDKEGFGRTVAGPAVPSCPDTIMRLD